MDSRRVEPYATATLIDFGDVNVIASAAHVFAEGHKHPLLVDGSPSGFILAGKVVSSAVGHGRSAGTDRYDLAFGFLTDSHRDKIEATGSRFLPLKEIVEANRVPQAKNCVFSGFPTTKSVVSVGSRTIVSTPFYVTCSLVKSKSLGADDYIVGRYNREELVLDDTGVRVMGPEAWGLSGGPVWLTFENSPPALAAIGTFFDPQRHELRGTRLERFVEEVAKHKPAKG